MDIGEILKNIWNSSGYHLFGEAGGWQNIVMIIVALVFLYLGIKKQFEPLLLVGIAFGMLLTNLPALDGDKIFHPEWWTGAEAVEKGVDYLHILQKGGLLDMLYIGVKTGVYPCLIFIGVGAMTDFGPMCLFSRLRLDSTADKPLRFQSSAARTARRLSSLQSRLRLNFLHLSPLRHIRIWHSFRSCSLLL